MASLLKSARRKSGLPPIDSGSAAVPAPPPSSSSSSLARHGSESGILVARVQYYDIVTALSVDRRARLEAILDAALAKLRTMGCLPESLDSFGLVDPDGKDVDLAQFISSSTYVGRCQEANVVPHFRLFPVTSRRRGGSGQGSISTSLPSFLNVFHLGSGSDGSMHRKALRHRSSTLSQQTPLADAPPDHAEGETRSRVTSTCASSTALPLKLEIPSPTHSDSELQGSTPSSLAGSNLSLAKRTSPNGHTRQGFGSMAMAAAISAASAATGRVPRSDSVPASPLSILRDYSTAPALGTGLPKDVKRSASGVLIIKVVISPAHSTHVACSSGTTIAQLLEKVLVKARRVLSESVDDMVFTDPDQRITFGAAAVVEHLSYVESCIAQNLEPTFILKHQTQTVQPNRTLLSPVPVVGTVEDDPENLFSLIEAYRADDSALLRRLSTSSQTYRSRRNSELVPLKSGDGSIGASEPAGRQVPSGVGGSKSLITTRFIRLDLPKGICTNLPISPDATVESVLEKCALKLKRIFNADCTKDDFELHQVGAMDDDMTGKVPLQGHILIAELDHFLHGEPLLFRVVCTTLALDYVDEDSDASEEATDEIAPPRQYATLTRAAVPPPMHVNCMTMRTPSVRVVLPKGVVTNVRITPITTAAVVLSRGLAKLKALVGEAFEERNFALYLDLSDGHEPRLLGTDIVFGDVPELEDIFGGHVELDDTVTMLVREKEEGGIKGKRRLSLGHLATRQPRVVTVEDLLREMHMSDVLKKRRRSSSVGTSSSLSVGAGQVSWAVNRLAAPDALAQQIEADEAGPTAKRRTRPDCIAAISFAGSEPFHVMVTATVAGVERLSVGSFLGTDSFAAVKALALAELCRGESPSDEASSGEWSLSYTHPTLGVPVLIADESMSLQQSTLSTLMPKHHCRLVLGPSPVERPSPLPPDIASLLDVSPNCFELSRQRATVERVRTNWWNVRRAAKTERLPRYLDRSDLPHWLTAKLKETNGRIPIRVHFPSDQAVKTMSCDVMEVVHRIVQRIAEKYNVVEVLEACASDAKSDSQETESFAIIPPHPFTLKCWDRDGHLHPEHRLIDHRSIRHYVGRAEPINLIISRTPTDLQSPSEASPSSFMSQASESPASRANASSAMIDEGAAAVGKHSQITLRGHADQGVEVKWLSLWDVSMNFRVEVVKAEGINLTGQAIDSVYVEAAVYFAGKPLCASVRTHSLKAIADPRWQNCIIFDLPLFNLPRNARLCLTLYGLPAPAKRGAEPGRYPTPIPIGGVSVPLFDDRGHIVQSASIYRLCEGQPANIVGPCTPTLSNVGPFLSLQFMTYSHQVVFPGLDETVLAIRNLDEALEQAVDAVGPDLDVIEQALKWDSLVQLDDASNAILWKHRYYLVNLPESLPKLLLAANWDLLADVIEVYRLLQIWRPISIETALLLLDGQFCDDEVRRFAVQTLAILADSELEDYLLQLVQALSFEQHFDSALARFLLNRALTSQRIGHRFFWTIKAEMDNSNMTTLYTMLLEAYLKGVPDRIPDLLHQQRLVDKLHETALAVKNTRASDRKTVLVNMLRAIEIAPGQSVPLNPEWHIVETLVHKCKYMDSKKLPLWITFRSSDVAVPMGKAVSVSVSTSSLVGATAVYAATSTVAVSVPAAPAAPPSAFAATSASATAAPLILTSGFSKAVSPLGLRIDVSLAPGPTSTDAALTPSSSSPTSASRAPLSPATPSPPAMPTLAISPIPSEICVMYKSGDDLRQDSLTLQMMRIMDRLWRENGLDLNMTLYECMSTGRDQGFIQVVPNSATVSSIQLAYGGSTAAFKEEPLETWIRQHNSGGPGSAAANAGTAGVQASRGTSMLNLFTAPDSPPVETEYDRAVATFTRSCAGYCVATYCLGIGDRHNDNLMCSKQGHLFHIDFGHFLGNIKRKFGIRRERAPFVLTPDFIYVITRKNPANFDFFVATCVRAYLILRRNANIFINLFLLMLSTGIPELQTVDDLTYLRDAFCLGMPEDEAAEEFQSLIFESIRLGWSTQLNWWYVSLAGFEWTAGHSGFLYCTNSALLALVYLGRVHNLVHNK
ncbi:hypothetical protein AMAG_01912 [Allomyces macrogynus ATCC 38327]|uniref:Phosphatidylinositol-4-phosphate 3-kinase n=1 Tax=Allomyces macrogynus (strain ATCC 38327) TaxID=578462 RepID=A0A0L0S0Y7_ALLM3|nr:hypothetical protein AMAG_01912 [Allomyces macrogynus ATCC 38327]|eukprot:KNE56070.1 hypothetical protein AMAG_01912 [Allomyces macrogynus ATCC 38327]